MTKRQSMSDESMPDDDTLPRPSDRPGEGPAPSIRVIFGPDEIATRIAALAREIKASGMDRLLVVPVLTGSFVFAADLIRALQLVGISPEVDFLSLSSYRRGLLSSGKVEILRDLDMEVRERDVLIVDDILESGRTLAFAKDLIAARGARRVATCVLLDKPVERAVQIKADFKAFDCPVVFVVGYGMDMAYRYRELPYVGQVITE